MSAVGDTGTTEQQAMQQQQQQVTVPSKEKRRRRRRRRLWNWVAAVLIAILSFFNVVSLRGGAPEPAASTRVAAETPTINERVITPPTSISVSSTNNPSWEQESSSLSLWNEALQQTVKLLYRDSPPGELEYWLAQPSPKIYIYDTIPAEFSNVETISQCVDRTFLGENSSDIESSSWVLQKKNCLWRPTVCQDTTSPNKPKQRMFVGYRYNYNTDVAYLDKFYRYPHQTKDPTKADLFVVPYPHKSHCLCHKNFKQYSAKCAVSFDNIQSNVLSNLQYFFQKENKNSKQPLLTHAQERHVFFHGADWLQQVKPYLEATSNSITLSLGPVTPCADPPDNNHHLPSCGHITVPYLTTDPDYQPHHHHVAAAAAAAAAVASDSNKWDDDNNDDRPYMVGAAMSATKGLPLRGQFMKNWSKWIGESIGGKPHHILHMGTRRSGKKPTSEEFMELYRNSTVCLILPGDGCAQKRFFDAILNGCIPLVPLFPSNEVDGAPYSFHHEKGCSTRITYPFAKGTFAQDPSAGFDIMDMVVTFNGTCGLACLKSALEELVVVSNSSSSSNSNNQTVFQEKRRKMRDYAAVLKFGLNSDSDGYLDVFSALIVSLRHHVWYILGRTPEANSNSSAAT